MIVSLINTVANVLDGIGSALSNEKVALGIMITLGAAAVIQISKKYEMQKLQNRAVLEENKAKIEQELLEKKNYLSELKALKVSKESLKTVTQEQLIKKGYDAATASVLAAKLAGITNEKELEAEIATTQTEIYGLQVKNVENSIQLAQNGIGFSSALGNALSILTPILSVMSMINMVQQAIVVNTKKQAVAQKGANAEKTKGLTASVSEMFASMVASAKTVPGVIAMIAAGALLATALGVTIAVAASKLSSADETENTASEINSLSNDIYKLTQKAESIKTITSSYEELDNQIVKTKEDQEEMNSLLEQAADSLDDDEKEIYEALSTNTLKKQYLDSIQEQALLDANSKRQEQLTLIEKMSPAKREELLSSTAADSDILTAQSALYAVANNEMYDYIDAMEEASSESAEY